MNKIVREHYPVENLPDDLRQLVADADFVTVEVTEEPVDPDAPPPLSVEDAVALMHEMQRHVSERGESVSWEEAVRRVRELRDEWDD